MKKVRLGGAIGILVIIMMRPQTAVSAAQRAMEVWITSVAPTLFPFLALLPLLTGQDACAAYEAIFSKWMRVLFGLPGAAAPAVIVGMIAGSPGGALALRRIAYNSKMKPGEVQQIGLVLAGVSPAYLIMGVGQGLYGSVSLGMKLAAFQFCIQLLLLSMLRGRRGNAKLDYVYVETENKNPIAAAVESLLGICGYMVFFSIVAAVLAGLIGKGIGSALLLVMDLPSGLANLVRMNTSCEKILLGAAVGFGGLCIGYQNMDIYQNMGIQWKDYIRVRGIFALFFACACALMDNVKVGDRHDIFENSQLNYAGALLIAGFLAIPGLYFLSRKLFLNNRTSAKKYT